MSDKIYFPIGVDSNEQSTQKIPNCGIQGCEKKAIVFCEQCLSVPTRFLCSDHSSGIHQIFKDHTLIPVEKKIKTKEKQPEKNYCKEHKDQELQFYCKKDDKIICSKCLYNKCAKDHIEDVLEIPKAIQYFQESIINPMKQKKLGENKNILTKMISSINIEMEESNKIKESMSQSLEKLKMMIFESLEKKFKQFQKYVDEVQEPKYNKLQQQLTQIQDELNSLDSIREGIEIFEKCNQNKQYLKAIGIAKKLQFSLHRTPNIESRPVCRAGFGEVLTVLPLIEQIDLLNFNVPYSLTKSKTEAIYENGVLNLSVTLLDEKQKLIPLVKLEVLAEIRTFKEKNLILKVPLICLKEKPGLFQARVEFKLEGTHFVEFWCGDKMLQNRIQFGAMFDLWDIMTKGKYLHISKDLQTISALKGGNANKNNWNIKGKFLFKEGSGLYHYRIEKLKSNKHFCIGVAKNGSSNLDYDSKDVWYICIGEKSIYKFCNGEKNWISGSGGLKINEFLDMYLDMDNMTLLFKKNNKELGVKFENIPNNVHLAASLHNKNVKISLVSCYNL
ncbi:hypothetical protein M0812_00024 [Anaeramoeba flamelloides]|uniref:B box-type domain-containing protein n=1 Tax=Anaeramoeba flamelloides TaxID=1746091 RepID=A0AAV8A4B1_9EUKA|nr:hypothetical protein M0812_00024 [Anaeramoeba flamelloides]